ncbi:MAG: 3-isopropylmalate dehydratase large subunit [Candidatus Lokiarchaeota archaeon]|nr:3-isopropylmalate dehydratase large subunit [Candidatus Lokiarchaeota archaeon]
MGMTIAEQILAAKCGRTSIGPGEFVLASVDVALANDITAPLAIKTFEQVGTGKVFDENKIALVLDHFTPNKDIASANQSKFVREFARKHKIVHFWDTGTVGIEHCLLPEQGIVAPGDLVVGADSHTCTYGALGAFATGMGSTDLGVAFALGKAWLKVPETIKFVYSGELRPWVSGKDLILHTIGEIGVEGANYKAMEFTGPTIDALDMAGRFTMCNMAIEAGGKAGIMNPDKKTEEYIKGRVSREYKVYKSDPDAVYSDTIEVDCSHLEPQVSFPHLPSNAKPISEVSAMRIPVDQVVIGSCTNGRIEDLRVAAGIMKGRKVHEGVRCVVLPGTQRVSLEAIKEGLFETLVGANCAVTTPTCGPCLGGHSGILAKGERAVSTTNRNFIGRMGDTSSEIYLASPAIAAATAVKGYICSPDDLETTTKVARKQ